ncbi:MAG: hypothetical protein IKF70_02725, partial [Firmicutes bacterium]|nr:hypothetical protein [Bacillota bacterium]
QITPLKGYVTFAKPDISVSTKEVYKGIDSCVIGSRPDNDRLTEELAACADPLDGASAEHRKAAAGEMINVLELYTLSAEPEVAGLKEFMERELAGAEKVLMSGSGPTVFALFGEDSRAEAEAARERLRSAGYEAHCAAL